MKPNRINANARLLCGAATFLALTATGAPVLAQDKTDEPAATVEDSADDDSAIVVTGIRGSIRTSLDAKRNATSIVEVITSEDIGLLPDLSIADSLVRLPGVTVQRVAWPLAAGLDPRSRPGLLPCPAQRPRSRFGG